MTGHIYTVHIPFILQEKTLGDSLVQHQREVSSELQMVTKCYLLPPTAFVFRVNAVRSTIHPSLLNQATLCLITSTLLH